MSVAPSQAPALNGERVDVEAAMPTTAVTNDQRTQNWGNSAEAPVVVDIVFESSHAGDVGSAVRASTARERPASERRPHEIRSRPSWCLSVGICFPMVQIFFMLVLLSILYKRTSFGFVFLLVLVFSGWSTCICLGRNWSQQAQPRASLDIPQSSALEQSNVLTKEAREALLTYFFVFAHPTTASVGSETAAEGKTDLPRPQQQQQQGKGMPNSSVDALDGSEGSKRWRRVGDGSGKEARRACEEGGGPDSEGWSTEASCIVCFGDYTDGERLCQLPCQHVFHAECINEWLDRARLPCCPLCKANLLEAGIPTERGVSTGVAGGGTATRAGRGGRQSTADVGARL
ncbi:unnamed protein product [Pylaiella littoralis]